MFWVNLELFGCVHPRSCEELHTFLGGRLRAHQKLRAILDQIDGILSDYKPH